MILESTQLLCTCLNKKGFSTPYKSTHVKHPCVLWLEQSYANFEWLKELALQLNREFAYRYDRAKDHASISVIKQIESRSFENLGLTEIVQAMPDRYKYKNNAVRAYRSFYRGEKAQFASWKKKKYSLLDEKITFEISTATSGQGL